MKNLFLLLLSILCFSVNAQTYYVSTSGNDLTGDGSVGKPWKTVRNATINVTSAGSTIHVNAGTYTESTSTLNLAVGVNLEGDGAATTIIKSGLTGQWSTFLNIESGAVTNGNQSISGLTFDGQYVSESNYKTWIGIWVTMRNNVTIKDCIIQGFYNRGVIFNGNGRNESTIPTDPGIYTTGNKVINNKFINTAGRDVASGTIFGQLNISGQIGMEISGNDMNQTQRPAGRNGEPVKYWGSGYLKNCKILNNTLKRLNFSGPSYNGDGDWNFAIELFNLSGLEIAGNTIQGSIDLNYNRVISPATYSVWIHDNLLSHTPVNTKEEQGIIFEFETNKAIVENNKFFDMAMGITFNVRTPTNNGGYNNPKPAGGYSATTDVTIRNNLFANLYSTPNSSAGMQFLTEGGTNDAYARNLQVYNNTFVTNLSDAAITGIDLSQFQKAISGMPGADGITIRNNIFVGFPGQYLEGGSSQMINTTTKDNCIWICGNNNNPAWTGSLVNTGNIKLNPGLDANYLVPQGSPIYGLGIGYQGTGTPPPPQCTFSYGPWVCNGNVATRTYTPSPAGCTGTPPADSLSRPCTSSNVPPLADAGPDKGSTLPTTSVALAGNGTDLDGSIVSYKWTSTGGTFSNAYSQNTTFNTSAAGTYTVTLTVTDNLGATGSDDAVITVNPAVQVNQPPVVSVGPDITIKESFALTSDATDDGTIVSYKWTKLSGPTCTIVTPNANDTEVLYSSKGTYKFQVAVKDNLGAITKKTVTVIIQ